jgi:hypothetical protein
MKKHATDTAADTKKYAMALRRRPAVSSEAAALVMARRTQISVPALAVPPTMAWG